MFILTGNSQFRLFAILSFDDYLNHQPTEHIINYYFFHCIFLKGYQIYNQILIIDNSN